MPKAVVNMRDSRPIWAITRPAVESISAAFPATWDVVVVDAEVDGRGDGSGVSDEALAIAPGTEVYFGYGLPRALLLSMTTGPAAALRWAHTGTAGVGGLLYDEMRASDVVLTNSAGVHAPPIAESVLGMMLHFARGFDHAVRSQARGQWEPQPFDTGAAVPRELTGATLGLLGLGGIGTELARRALALGMRVRALRRSDRAGPAGVDVVRGESGLAALLGESDYVVVTMPGTAETHDLLNADALALMKPSAVLVNIARGDILNERALADALRAGRLRGAGLDVFRSEPLPADSPLWSLPNVLITPHVSAATPRFWERETELIRDNITRYLAGSPLRNVVDKTRGY
ncbi:MAG: D-2-hydroxyacid dehydrogenase [Longimicrobiales bacterium]